MATLKSSSSREVRSGLVSTVSSFLVGEVVLAASDATGVASLDAIAMIDGGRYLAEPSESYGLSGAGAGQRVSSVHRNNQNQNNELTLDVICC